MNLNFNNSSFAVGSSTQLYSVLLYGINIDMNIS